VGSARAAAPARGCYRQAPAAHDPATERCVVISVIGVPFGVGGVAVPAGATVGHNVVDRNIS
jgi:hypothetical protein